MLVASEDATSGSVIANAERISPGQQRLEPPLLLLLGAEQGQHLHVAGVGRLAVDRLRGEVRAAPGELGDGGVLEVGQPGPSRVGQEEVPQAALAGLGLQLLHHRRVGRVAVPRRAAPRTPASAGKTCSRMNVPHPGPHLLGAGVEVRSPSVASLCERARPSSASGATTLADPVEALAEPSARARTGRGCPRDHRELEVAERHVASASGPRSTPVRRRTARPARARRGSRRRAEPVGDRVAGGGSHSPSSSQ